MRDKFGRFVKGYTSEYPRIGKIPWNKGKIFTPIKNCLVCGKPFKAEVVKKGKRKQFCSRKCSKTGTHNPVWKGDDVKLGPLHRWIEKHKPKPELCEDCKLVPPRDLANISQEYHRDVNDFEWLCRKCHMTKDGRLEKVKQTQFKVGDKIRLGSELSWSQKQRIAEKVKDLWMNPEYRKNMSEKHKKNKNFIDNSK